MVAFRKRFDEKDLEEILGMTIPSADDEDDDPPDGGTPIMDVTCCPADIAYPQDVSLLNEAREKLENMIDEVCEA